MKIGIVALQGAFIEHCRIFQKLGLKTKEVRLPADLDGVQGLVIPGGESTTILKLMQGYQLVESIKKLAGENIPVWGTCAGLICLAKNVFNPDGSLMPTLGLMDIAVRRNASGRQVDSFEVQLDVVPFKEGPFPGVFIRAPYIDNVGEGVEVLARLPDDIIVAARQKNLLATSFHPELTDDVRFHRYFSDMLRH
ncbi:MAG: pyridoxal 5'-phosphate synthase glutaminase subunit PdxT [Dehalococcoidia bacterium]|nr:pyridoxal 5'-phosphate synthase glutaminase subunit PdxT [Dehalococcoidia bacterium]